MKTSEFLRWLREQGVRIGRQGKGSHLKVYRQDRSSIVPMHRSKELGKGLVEKIKNLGLK
jgi:mRNA interferase HicA